jgi:preprotein translocase subunit SecF
MAALLTIFGYSLNDTVVIFDRIREMIVLKPGAKFYDIINDALSSTVARTLLTSLTTMLAVLSLLVFGGGAIFEFALIMFFGVIVGTYSSVFVASSFINTWSKRAAKATATREVAK